MKTNEKLKEKLEKMTTELMEAKSSYESNKLLLQHKLEHVENQKEQYKNELNEVQKKLESNLDLVQSRNLEEKEKIEKSFIEKINALETKYTAQINSINEKHSSVYNEIFNNNKILKEENKTLKLEYEAKIKNMDSTANKGTIDELTEQIERLKQDLEASRKSVLAKNNELRAQFEKEKEAIKLKNNELEQKVKELENKRSTVIFDMELERSKWQSEKENLSNNISQLKEDVDELRSLNESIKMENVKLKSEKSNLGKSKLSGVSRLGGGVVGTGGRTSGNPYSNLVGGIGMSKIGGLDKLLDADESGIGNTSILSNLKGDYKTNNKKNTFDTDEF